MLIGMVEGSVISTVKHASMKGWKLLIVQPLNEAGQPDGDPQLAIDSIGAGRGIKVLMTNDGKGARELVGDTTSPVRWSIVGLVDHD
jgi:ethanolamine utilization protein EutN